MKTIFNANKRHLRVPHFVVVYPYGRRSVRYEVVGGANEKEQRAWQQERVEWGRENGRADPTTRVAYLINVYPKIGGTKK